MVSLKPLFGYLAYHDISLKELSEKTGISYATLKKMRNTDDFTIRVIDRICLCLNLNIKDIMAYKGECKTPYFSYGDISDKNVCK